MINEFTGNCLIIGIHNALILLAQIKGGDKSDEPDKLKENETDKNIVERKKVNAS